MRRQRPFFQHHALQPALVVFEKFRRAQIAGDQDRVLAQTLCRCRAKLARHNPQQPVRQVFQIVHPVRQQWIVDLAHAHARALLYALDGGFCGQAAIDRLIDAAAPALVISEHLVGLEHFLMLRPRAEFDIAGHAVDLVAHLGESAVDPLPLHLDIIGNHLIDGHARLVIDGNAAGEPFDERQPLDRLRPGRSVIQIRHGFPVDEFGIGDQFRQNHCRRLQRLDLDLFIPARIDMLDVDRANGTLAVDDRHTGEGVEFLLPRFRPVLEVRMRRRLCQVERFVIGDQRAGQPFAHSHPGYMDSFLVQAFAWRTAQASLPAGGRWSRLRYRAPRRRSSTTRSSFPCACMREAITS